MYGMSYSKTKSIPWVWWLIFTLSAVDSLQCLSLLMLCNGSAAYYKLFTKTSSASRWVFYSGCRELKNVQLLGKTLHSSLSVFTQQKLTSAQQQQQQQKQQNVEEKSILNHCQVRPSSLRSSAFPLFKARARANTRLCADRCQHFYFRIMATRPNQIVTLSALRCSQLAVFRRAPGVFSQKKTLWLTQDIINSCARL